MAAPIRSSIFSSSILLIIVYLGITSADEEFEGLTRLSLEHTYDDNLNAEFVKRGTITVKSLKTGGAYFHPENVVTESDRDQIEALAMKKGIYRVRIPTRTGNGKQIYVSTFMPGCSLYESKLSDVLTLNVDQTGNLLGLSMTTHSPYCHGLKMHETDLYHFNTSVSVVTSITGPVPDTQTYIQHIAQQQAEREKSSQSDNRSFLAKYWMYLVPLLIFFMIASNSQEQGGS